MNLWSMFCDQNRIQTEVNNGERQQKSSKTVVNKTVLTQITRGQMRTLKEIKIYI